MRKIKIRKVDLFYDCRRSWSLKFPLYSHTVFVPGEKILNELKT